MQLVAKRTRQTGGLSQFSQSGGRELVALQFAQVQTELTRKTGQPSLAPEHPQVFSAILQKRPQNHDASLF